MKNSLIYSLLIAFFFIVSGCNKDFLDPVRNTNVLTSVDIANNSDLNPALIEGSLSGILSFMIEPGGVTQPNRHYDLGQKGVDIFIDILSSDMALSKSTYGWYNSTANLVATVDFTREENKIIWDYYYKVIHLANNVIISSGGNDAIPEGPEAKRILGQAKTYRAYAYFYLTQLFQKKYDPNQEILPFYDGVQVITAKVPASQIYNLIIDDLTDAISLLDGYVRPDKMQIDKTIAQGFLAYTYAAIGDYESAAPLAETIIASGYPLTTKGELAYPGDGSGFNNINTPSWIWGYDLTSDLGHQLLDWWGQIDYYTYSYAWAGDAKSIDNLLYNTMPSYDIRKTQFGNGFTALQPVNKFFDPNRTAGGQQIVTTDLIFMRVDEFYLLSAEANAHIGNEGLAKTRLVELLTSRLDGSTNAEAYVSPLTGQALKDAIYLQTRLELWGEGKSYLAMKRNKANVTRGTNHVFRAGQSFIYDSDELSYQIPQSEINNNPSITDQN